MRFVQRVVSRLKIGGMMNAKELERLGNNMDRAIAAIEQLLNTEQSELIEAEPVEVKTESEINNGSVVGTDGRGEV